MVEVCIICGDKGFSNALLDCSECSVASAHQYCLGIPPGSIDDSFDWVCECCAEPMESESCQFGGVWSVSSGLQCCNGDLINESRSEIVVLPKQPEPLCMLSPIQYNGSSTRETTSNLFQEHEAAISSYMDHPDSIMRGIVLLVSPSGEVFIDEEKSSLNIREPFDDAKESEVAAHIVVSDAEVWSSNPVGSSTEDSQRGMLKRTLEPEVEVIQRKKARVYNSETDAEGPSSEPTGNSMEKHELVKQKADIYTIEYDGETEVSLVTALAAQPRKSVRKKIVTMLLSAGWTVEYKPRIIQTGKKADIVYVSPQGKIYWSLPRAYRTLERDFEKAKAKKRKGGGGGGGSGNSNFHFKPLSKELLNVFNQNNRSNKKNKS